MLSFSSSFDYLKKNKCLKGRMISTRLTLIKVARHSVGHTSHLVLNWYNSTNYSNNNTYSPSWLAILTPLSLFPTGSHAPLTARWACNLKGTSYIYSSDLLALEGLPYHYNSVTPTSPLSLSALEPFLATHPDPRFAHYIHRGFQQGFRIGFSNPSSPLRDASRNHPSPLRDASRNHLSAYQHTNTVSEHLVTEIQAGRLIRADPPSPQT